MTPTQQAIAKIEALEREDSIRHEEVERRLERGDKRFDKLEMMIWTEIIQQTRKNRQKS